MKHPRTEEGHLGGLVIGNIPYADGIIDNPRVCAADSVHVSPDFDTGGIQRHAEYGCRVVRAFEAENRSGTV